MASWHSLTISSSDFPGWWNWFELSKPGTKFVILHFLEREELRDCQSHPHFPQQKKLFILRRLIFFRISFRTEVVIPLLALPLERLVRCHWKKSETPTSHFPLGSMEEMSFAKPSLFVSTFSCTTNLNFPVIFDMMPNVSQVQRIIVSCATKNDH